MLYYYFFFYCLSSSCCLPRGERHSEAHDSCEHFTQTRIRTSKTATRSTMFQKLSVLLILGIVVCNAVEVRKTSSSETQLFWNKLQAAYAKGEPYTGPLYVEGKASLKTKNLKVSDVEVVIDKPRDDGQKKTNLHFKLVASFDEVYVQQYILDMPFIKGREFDYRVVSECGSNGVELQFSLTYDVKEAEYSHSRKQTVLRCHENTEENIT